MGEPIVLSFDIGTQSAKCTLVTKDGSYMDFVRDKYAKPYYSEQPGFAEQSPEFYYNEIIKTAREICSRNTSLLGDIIGVTVSVIRDSVLCLDSENRPLRSVILWSDSRKAEYRRPFPLWKRAVFTLCGAGKTAKNAYRATHANWIKQNEPEIWAKTAKYVMLPTYLNYRMTGNLADCEANMIGHIPYDCRKRCWKGKLSLTACVTDAPREKLIQPIKSGEIIGRISESFSAESGIPTGLPLIATGSDKGCETLGLSVIFENRAAISYGTTATLQMSVKKYFSPQRFFPAYPAVAQDRYNPETEIYGGFWTVSWALREFGECERRRAEEENIPVEKLFDRCIEKIPAGSDGLIVQPHWIPGISSPESKGAIVGFRALHTRSHLYRAVVEGIVFELYGAMLKMQRRSRGKISELFVAGGGAESDEVCRITADVFGLPVKRIQTCDACPLGAAMAAFTAAGYFDDYETAAAAMVHENDCFMPRAREHEIYMDIYYNNYKRISDGLNPVYSRKRKQYLLISRRSRIEADKSEDRAVLFKI